MSLPLHLVPDLQGVQVGSIVDVTGDEAHHAVAVRRLRVGEPVSLSDGRGCSVTGVVSATGKRSLSVRVESISHQDLAMPAVTVVQALPKGERGELAVEVLRLGWIGSCRGRHRVRWPRGRANARSRAIQKWVATAREAAKQSRRGWLVNIAPLTTTAGLAPIIAEADLALVLHEEATTPLAALSVPEVGRVVVIVGPEGGVSAEELAAFEQAGASAVRLGAEVLRTSTAGVVAVAALLSRTPRWS